MVDCRTDVLFGQDTGDIRALRDALAKADGVAAETVVEKIG